MIVNKPIGSIKVGNTISRLTIGKDVPKSVIDYWKKTKQYDELIKNGSIIEKKTKSEKGNNEFIRPTEKR